MSLNYDLTKVKNYKDLNSTVTDTIIYHTMFVGVNEITAKNAAMLYKRINYYERLFGPMLNKADGTPRYVTQDDITARIGLSTNATNLTGHAFNQRCLNRFYAGV